MSGAEADRDTWVLEELAYGRALSVVAESPDDARRDGAARGEAVGQGAG